MGHFNRKERKLIISKKLHGKKDFGRGNKKVNWRQKHFEEKRAKEAEFINENFDNEQFEAECSTSSVVNEESNTNVKDTWYSLSIALPGSILNNILKETLTAYVVSEIARTFATFCIDEVIVYDETATMSENLLQKYNEGAWEGDWNTEEYVECNFYMAKILEYMECPQYLRKALHPFHPALKFAGLLNPLNGMHHLKAYELDIPYREGVTVDKAIRDGKGSWCDIGLNKLLQLSPGEVLPPNTRVSVKITSDLKNEIKKLSGTLTNAKTIRKESGIYWGYNVRVVSRFSQIFSQSYDYIVGTSERGRPIEEIHFDFKENCKILVVFGGLSGLEAVLEADDSIHEKKPERFFERYLNALPDQGSRVIRTEEALPITLSMLKYRLNGIAHSHR